MAHNDWCRALGIEVPRLEAVREHSDAIPYSLLLVALLERGEAMTLEEVARNCSTLRRRAGWSDPWSRAQLARVVRGESQWRCSLIDEAGYPIDETAVQRARLADTQA